jgi:hypothetical protein
MNKVGMEIWQKAGEGQKVKLVEKHGEIPAGTVGVVSSVHSHSQTYQVRICGVDLYLYGSEFEVVDESVNASANSGAGGLAGIDGKQSDIASASNGGGAGAGLVAAGEGVAKPDYSIAQAVSELEALAYGVGYEKDEYILDIAGKLKTIAA